MCLISQKIKRHGQDVKVKRQGQEIPMNERRLKMSGMAVYLVIRRRPNI